MTVQRLCNPVLPGVCCSGEAFAPGAGAFDHQGAHGTHGGRTCWADARQSMSAILHRPCNQCTVCRCSAALVIACAVPPASGDQPRSAPAIGWLGSERSDGHKQCQCCSRDVQGVGPGGWPWPEHLARLRPWSGSLVKDAGGWRERLGRLAMGHLEESRFLCPLGWQRTPWP